MRDVKLNSWNIVDEITVRKDGNNEVKVIGHFDTIRQKGDSLIAEFECPFCYTSLNKKKRPCKKSKKNIHKVPINSIDDTITLKCCDMDKIRYDFLEPENEWYLFSKDFEGQPEFTLSRHEYTNIKYQKTKSNVLASQARYYQRKKELMKETEDVFYEDED